MSSKTNSKLFHDMVNKYLSNVSNKELEVRFGTKRNFITKNDYDNVIKKLMNLGFECLNKEGEYFLRIQNEFLSNRGITLSKVRTEIQGLTGIQEYCRHNNIHKMLNHYPNISFYQKNDVLHEEKKIFPIDFDDYHCRISLQSEDYLNKRGGFVERIIESWNQSKKVFRYLNRISFVHSGIPIRVDLSIVKMSKKNGKNKLDSTINIGDSNVFKNPEMYEIELEVLNDQARGMETYELLDMLKLYIKYILSGLQNTNYPIPYTEQINTMVQYASLIGVKKDIIDSMVLTERNKFPRKLPSIYFIGYSSYTLQLKNIVPINPELNVPNIRNDFVVTDKADGDRHLLFINDKGKIYLINTNMSVIFTGCITTNEDCFDSLLDGELILHDKTNNFINLFAIFDIYFIKKRNIRSLPFMPLKKEDSEYTFRFQLLTEFLSKLNVTSIIPNEIKPMRIESKRFYPNILDDTDIFLASNQVLSYSNEYNTDGLIFTPAYFGVGSNKPNSQTELKKTTWEHSFKWKPPEFNTIDFLVTTKKNDQGNDIITPIFEDGINALSQLQLNQYKTLILRCGYSIKQHGYINPVQELLDNRIFNAKEDEEDYKPVQFYPSNPSDNTAGMCHIMLQKDSSQNNQMITEEGEVFNDNMVVEFKYDLSTEKSLWRWIPLRVRYDKTTEYKAGKRSYGNDYKTANNNWYSIHNPITIDMISTGQNIPEEIIDDDIYYNRNSTITSDTKGLRDFHNLFVKQTLIFNTSQPKDTLIDYACGKAGDLPKWIKSKLSFVLGIDISSDNIENKIDGACARYLNAKKDFHLLPQSIFLQGNTSMNIKTGECFSSTKNYQLSKIIFGNSDIEESKIPPALKKHLGVAHDGFQISSVQFAFHYFCKDPVTYFEFLRNVSECTKVNGYFIGSCYNGSQVFKLLDKTPMDESISIYEKETKIWEIIKKYDKEYFNADESSLGYEILVYQDTINKYFSEYLVNFDFLIRCMENYGFQLAEPSEIHLPNSLGSFEDLHLLMKDIIKKDRSKESMFGDAPFMTHNEKRISFLNNYFIFKKIRNISNTAQLTKEFIDKFTGELPPQKEYVLSPTIIEEPTIKKIKKIKKVIILEQEQEEKPKKEKPKIIQEEETQIPKKEEQEEPTPKKEIPKTKKEEKELEKQRLKEEKELEKQRIKEEKELEKQRIKEEKELEKQRLKEEKELEKKKLKEDKTKTKKNRKE
jgi:hypothetical protein